ncbi:kinesin-related protein 2-like, partial [Aphis craccivora]
SSINEEEDSSEKDPSYSKNFYFYFTQTPPSKQKSISNDLPQTFPGTSYFKRKLDFSTMNKCKSLSPKPKMSNVINFDEVKKIITTSSSPFKVTASNSIQHSNNDVLTKINRTTLNTWYEIKGLAERIKSLENALLNKGFKEVFNDDLDNGLIFLLPLSNEEELEIFEQKLLDTAFSKKLNYLVWCVELYQAQYDPSCDTCLKTNY